MTTTKLSIIIPTYNRAQMLSESITSSLPALEFGSEIIVVDDGSTDETPNIAASFGEKIKYIYQENQGKSTALNHAFKHLTSQYVLILDDDDIVEISTVRNFLQYLEDNPEIDYVFGKYIPFYEDEKGELHYTNAIPEHINQNRIFYDLLVSNFFHLNSTIFRRHCVELAGLFDTRLVRSQDYDFLMRLVHRCKGYYLAQTVFYLRKHPGYRGSSAVSVPADRVSELWNRFDRFIGEKIRENVELESFIRDDLNSFPEAIKLRAALFQRAHVMASKHLISEAFTDLELGLKELAKMPNTLTQAEKESILGMFSVPTIKQFLQDRENFKKNYDLFSSKNVRQARLLLLKRIYWDLLISLRERHYQKAMDLLKKIGLIQINAVKKSYYEKRS